MPVDIVWYRQVSPGIARYCEGSKKPLDDPVPNGDFPVLHCLGIGSSVSGIRSDQIRKYMSKFEPIPNLQLLVCHMAVSTHSPGRSL